MNNLTSETFDKSVLLTSGLVLVDFYAEWCGPCKAIAPMLEKLEETYTGVTFFKVDIDSNFDLAERFKISSVPTFKLIKKGRVIFTQVGISSPSALESLIRTNLPS